MGQEEKTMAKYCTKCGRKLEDGEVCNCTSQSAGSTQNAEQQAGAGQQQYQQGQSGATQQQYQQGQTGAVQQQYQQGQPGSQQQYYQQGQPGGTTKESEWINRQKDVIISGTKNMFSEIIPILKAPVSRVREISAAGSSAGLQLIIAKAVIFLVVMLIAMLVISSRIREISYGFVTIDMPYFQLILLTLLLTAGVDLLEAVLLKSITGAFKGMTNVNTMFNVIGGRCIYDTIVFLLVIILGIISWNAAFVVLIFATPISVYIQFSAYQGCVRMSENRRPYAYFLTKLCMSVISFLVVYLIIRNYISTIMNYILY